MAHSIAHDSQKSRDKGVLTQSNWLKKMAATFETKWTTTCSESARWPPARSHNKPHDIPSHPHTITSHRWQQYHHMAARDRNQHPITTHHITQLHDNTGHYLLTNYTASPPITSYHTTAHQITTTDTPQKHNQQNAWRLVLPQKVGLGSALVGGPRHSYISLIGKVFSSSVIRNPRSWHSAVHCP